MSIGIASAPDVIAQEPQQPPQDQEQSIEQKADDVYVALDHTEGNLTTEKSTLDVYTEKVTEFLKGYAPGIERDEIGFEALVDSFARGLNRDGGSMHRITFNNIVDSHRTYIELARVVDSYDNINHVHANWIKQVYADLFIKRGGKSDISDVQKRLDKIPDEYHIVRSKKGDTVEGMISQHYNNFDNLNPQEKRRVLDFVYDINPISISYGVRAVDGSFVTYLLGTGYEDRAVIAVPKSDFLDRVASGQK